MRDFEIKVIKFFRDSSTPTLDALMQICTVLGEQYILILGMALLYFVFDKRLGLFVAYSLFQTLLINNTIKGIVKYSRPFVYDQSIEPSRSQTATGYSFPSGHTQNATTFYSSMIYNSKYKNKTLFWIIFSIIVLLIGFSRIYLGVHYIKDVVVGIALGLVVTYVSSLLLKRFEFNFKNKMILFSASLLIYFPFLFIFYQKEYQDILIYRDFYLGYSLYLGFVIGVLIDQKYVNFSTNTTLKKKLIRFAGCAVCFLVIEFGIKKIFNVISTESIVLDSIRYFLLTFLILGIYPFIFRKNLFKD